jgi:hypothetical protein
VPVAANTVTSSTNAATNPHCRVTASNRARPPIAVRVAIVPHRRSTKLKKPSVVDTTTTLCVALAAREVTRLGKRASVRHAPESAISPTEQASGQKSSASASGKRAGASAHRVCDIDDDSQTSRTDCLDGENTAMRPNPGAKTASGGSGPGEGQVMRFGLNSGVNVKWKTIDAPSFSRRRISPDRMLVHATIEPFWRSKLRFVGSFPGMPEMRGLWTPSGSSWRKKSAIQRWRDALTAGLSRSARICNMKSHGVAAHGGSESTLSTLK